MSNGTDTQHKAPLDHLDEKLLHDGAQWVAEGPRFLYVIRWFSKSGNVTALRMPGAKVTHRGTAQTIEEARGAALRMSGLIADGKKG